MKSQALLKSLVKPKKSVERITPKHYEQLELWYKRHNKRFDPSVCSDMGFIVDGRVAGFLYVTNSNVAMIEGLISDPHTIPSLRRQSLRKLIGVLLDTATMLGFTNVFALTQNTRVIDLSREYGFQATPFTLLTLNAEKD